MHGKSTFAEIRCLRSIAIRDDKEHTCSEGWRMILASAACREDKNASTFLLLLLTDPTVTMLRWLCSIYWAPHLQPKILITCPASTEYSLNTSLGNLERAASTYNGRHSYLSSLQCFGCATTACLHRKEPIVYKVGHCMKPMRHPDVPALASRFNRSSSCFHPSHGSTEMDFRRPEQRPWFELTASQSAAPRFFAEKFCLRLGRSHTLKISIP